MKHIKLFESFGIKYKVIAVNMETREAVGVFPSYRDLEDNAKKGASMLSRFGAVEGAEDIYDSLNPKATDQSYYFVYPMIDIPDDHDIVVCNNSSGTPEISTMSSRDLKEPAVGDSSMYNWYANDDGSVHNVYYRVDRNSGKFVMVGAYGHVDRMSPDEIVEMYNYGASL